MKHSLFFLLLSTVLSTLSAQDKNEERLLDSAFEAFDNQNYELAVTYFDSLIELRPDVWILYSEKGRAQIQLTQYNAAIQTIKDGLEVFPENEDLLLNLGTAYHFGQNHNAYLALKKQYYEKYPTEPAAIVDYASSLYRMGDYETALQYLYKAESINKKDLDVQYLIGFMLRVLDENKSAQKHLKKVASKSKDQFLKLLAYSDLDEMDKANEILERLIKENPKNPYNYEMKAAFLMVDKKFEAAISNMNEALKFQEHPNATLMELAYCYIRLGNYDKAIELLEPIVTEYPSFYKAQATYCRALIEKGELDKVQAMIDDIIAIKPLHPIAYFTKGLLCLKQGNKELACKNFLKAKERHFLILYPTENLAGYLEKCKY